MEMLIQDVWYALRGLWRTRGVLALAVGTLALGLGVLTAAFTVVNAVILRPITYDQDRVVRVWQRDNERGAFHHPFSYDEFVAARTRVRSFSALAAIQYADATTVPLTIGDESLAVAMTPVSAAFFPILTTRAPVVGRWFNAGDEAKGAQLVAVVSEAFWRRAANADLAFVGRRFRLGGGRTVEVVGIAPADLDYPVGTDAWVPITTFFDGLDGRFDASKRQFSQFELIGRFAPDASIGRAASELEASNRERAAAYRGNYGVMGITIEPLLDTQLGSSRLVLLALLAAATLVLVIAGANVAALLLMRASVKRREAAIRLALGASYWRLTRMTLLESATIALFGAVAGTLIALLLINLVRSIDPGNVPRLQEATIDRRVLALGIGVAVAWIFTLGLTPAWAGRRLAPTSLGDLGTRGPGRASGLRLFTALQVAVAAIVTVAAGLLVRSFTALERIDRGFDPERLIVVRLLTPEDSYPTTSARLDLFARLVSHVEAVPGVDAATPVHMEPGTGDEGLSALVVFEGQTEDDAKTNPWATFDPVMPAYFSTMGIPIVQGRSFTVADRRGGAGVTIVSESVAHQYWPGQQAVGKHLHIKGLPSVEVVGVALDTRYRELTKTWMTVYFPAAQFFFFSPSAIVVRTKDGSTAAMPAVQSAIRKEEPRMVIERTVPMHEDLARETSRQRMAFGVMTAFSLVAVLLSAVGVFGIVSYEVDQRRRELAIRSALGAPPSRLFSGVLGQALFVGGVGVVGGLSAARLLTGRLATLLYSVSQRDVSSFAGSALIILVITAMAAVVPAIRAASTNAVQALRHE